MRMRPLALTAILYLLLLWCLTLHTESERSRGSSEERSSDCLGRGTGGWIFKSPNYEDISLGEWMAHTPHQLVNQHLQVGTAMLDAIPKDEMVIVPV
jgi:hypothetical protein